MRLLLYCFIVVDCEEPDENDSKRCLMDRMHATIELLLLLCNSLMVLRSSSALYLSVRYLQACMPIYIMYACTFVCICIDIIYVQRIHYVIAVMMSCLHNIYYI